MDSCQFFNLLFGGKKATSEISKCLSSALLRQAKQAQNNNDNNSTSSSTQSTVSSSSTTAASQSPAASPLKQIQTKLKNLTSKGRQAQETPPSAESPTIDLATVAAANEAANKATRNYATVDDLRYDSSCDNDNATSVYKAMLVDADQIDTYLNSKTSAYNNYNAISNNTNTNGNNINSNTRNDLNSDENITNIEVISTTKTLTTTSLINNKTYRDTFINEQQEASLECSQINGNASNELPSSSTPHSQCSSNGDAHNETATPVTIEHNNSKQRRTCKRKANHIFLYDDSWRDNNNESAINLLATNDKQIDKANDDYFIKEKNNDKEKRKDFHLLSNSNNNDDDDDYDEPNKQRQQQQLDENKSKRISLLAIRKNSVRELIGSFESPLLLQARGEECSSLSPTATDKNTNNNNNNRLSEPQIRLSKLLSSLAGLHSFKEIFQDDVFLRRLFSYLEPLDRCSAAQVCRKWRTVLYSSKQFWRDTILVIDCTELRRRHLIECIRSALNSTRVKQHLMQSFSSDSIDDKFFCERASENYSNSNSSNQIDLNELWRIQEFCARIAYKTTSQTSANCVSYFSPCATRGKPNTIIIDNNANSNTSNSNSSSKVTLNASVPESLSSTSSSAVGSSVSSSSTVITENYSNLPNIENQPLTLAVSKSSSIQSQISSQNSSLMSLSSLLSPLSECSKIDLLKDKLYTSIESRGIEAICLFGATDDEIDELLEKLSPTTHNNIVQLKLNNCFISNQCFEFTVRKLTKINALELHGCNSITDSINLRALPELRKLTITDCIIIGDRISIELAPIAASSLQELTIQSYHFTDAFVEMLVINAINHKQRMLNSTDKHKSSETSNENHQQCFNNSNEDEEDDEAKESQAAQTATNLRTFELINCKEVTNQTLAMLAQHFKPLTKLSLSGSTKISDIGVDLISENLRSLTRLDISWCPRLTDATLEHIACDLNETLRELIIDRNQLITDHGIEFVSLMQNLNLFHMRWCVRVTDDGFSALLDNGSLKNLSIAGCNRITENSLRRIANSAPKLEEIELTNCSAVNDKLLSFLETKRPKLTILF